MFGDRTHGAFELANQHIGQHNQRLQAEADKSVSCCKNTTEKVGKKTTFHENMFSEGKSTVLRSDQYELNNSDDLNTLGDCLLYFGLSSRLQGVEKSLEDLRRNKINKENHEDYFRQFDKEVQKLSIKYHPDKVRNRGSSEEEIAQHLQTALNATRTALQLLNSAFVEDIDIEHKFGFYTKLSITSLCNEDEMKSHLYEVIFKISMISRIKQQNIICVIRQFLIESKNCVSSYLEDGKDFEKHRDLALFYLKNCIKGFEKLYAELEDVQDECESEKNDENILSLLESMANESKKDLSFLKSLETSAKASVKGRYTFFSTEEVMDLYYVLPLVSYTNVILMCNAVKRPSSFFDFLTLHDRSHPYFNEELNYLMDPYYLASYYSGNKFHESRVYKIMGKAIPIQRGSKIQISKVEIEVKFHKCIDAINGFMKDKFKVEDYYEASATNLLALDLKECSKLMAEFQEKQEEVSKGIKEFQKEAEKRSEKCYDMMETTEELNREVKEQLEQNKKFRDTINTFLNQE